MVDLEKYRGKKVFLTGHTGFKGSWFVACLNQLGAEVRGYSLEPNHNNDLYHIINGNSLCHSVIGDIRDSAQLSKEIKYFQPDFIFHLAAQPLVRVSYELPLETYEVNILGTANLLDGARGLNKKCIIIIITTDKVYENNEWHYPYRESDRLGGYDPYSSSKACAELIVSSYRNSFFNQKHLKVHKKSLATARAGNVIGGGDWSKDRIIPDIVKAINSSTPIEIRNPESVRPWQHVLEPLIGYLTLGIKMSENPEKYNKAWNFGPFFHDNITVSDLAARAIKVWGKGDIKYKNNQDFPHEASLLMLDISQTVAELGWQPRWNSTEAIEKTIDWYKQYLDFSNNILNDQINQYFKLLKRNQI